MMSNAMSARPRRTLLGATAVIAVLASCTLNETRTRQAEAPAAATTPNVDPLSLALSAHRNNSLMRFDAAAREYQRLTLGSDDDAVNPELDLRYALAQSNVGQFEEADRIFAEFDDTQRETASPIAIAEADTFHAQHVLNKWRWGYGNADLQSALNFGRGAIDGFATASEASSELPEDLKGIPDEIFAKIYAVEQTSAGVIIPASTATQINESLSPARIAGFGISDGLTNAERRALKEAHAYYVTSYALALLGRYNEAATELESVNDRLSRIPSDFPHWLLGASSSLNGIIALRSPVPQTDIAVASFEDAARLERSIGSESRAAALALLKLGEAREAANNMAGAAESYEDGLELVERSGGALDLAQATSYIQFLLKQPKSAANDAQLFRTVQAVQSLGTARALSEVAFQLQSGTDSRSTALQNLIQQREKADALRARLARIRGASRSSREASFIRDELRAVSLREEQARIDAGPLADALDSFTRQKVSLSDFQRRLAPGEQVVLIQVGDAVSFVTAITANNMEVREVDFTTAEAKARVARIKDMLPKNASSGLATNDFAFEDAYTIYRKLLAPVASTLGQESTLTVIPTGALASLPFSILTTAPYSPAPPVTTDKVPYHDYSNAPWLAKKVPVASSLSILSLYNVRGVRDRVSSAPKPFLGYGDFAALTEEQAERIAARKDRITPDCGEWIQANGEKTLPNTADEILNITNIINRALGTNSAEGVLRAQFTDAAIRDGNLGKYKVLHFATHGLLSSEIGNRRCLTEPALWTSFGENDGESDALLGASEIAQLDLNADLIVLSACDTGGGSGSGSVLSGESLSGLTRSFFVAGARNIVASHWKVASNATQQLMESFYGNLVAPSAKPLALTLSEAKLDMIATGNLSHPFYWGAFTVFGDGTDTISLQ